MSVLETFHVCLCMEWVFGWGWGLDAPAHPSATILWPRVTCSLMLPFDSDYRHGGERDSSLQPSLSGSFWESFDASFGRQFLQHQSVDGEIGAASQPRRGSSTGWLIRGSKVFSVKKCKSEHVGLGMGLVNINMLTDRLALLLNHSKDPVQVSWSEAAMFSAFEGVMGPKLVEVEVLTERLALRRSSSG